MGYSGFPMCVFVFKRAGCHLKSTEAAQSALNLAVMNIKSGEGKKKSAPTSDPEQTLCCFFVCFWPHQMLKERKEFPGLSKHKLTLCFCVV